MTIRHKNKAPGPSAPAGDEVMVIAEPAADPYTSGSNVNVPYAEATTVEAQPQGSEPDQQRIAYSTGSPPQASIATATGSPVIRVEGVPSITTTALRNDRGCCNERSCCCVVSTVIFLVFFVCCLLPFIVFLVINAVVLASNPDMFEDDDNIYGFTDDNGYGVTGDNIYGDYGN